jgi:hypothetical protein
VRPVTNGIQVGTPEWDALTERRAELIHKKNREGLDEVEQVEFDRLQRMSLDVVNATFPRPKSPPLPKTAAPPERPKPPAKRPEKARQRPPTGDVARDALGFRVGTGAAQINTGLSDKWKTADQIATDSGAARTVGGHLAKLVEVGFAEKRGKGPTAEYRFTAKALQLTKK